MFSGIVEELGEVLALRGSGDSATLQIRGPVVTADTGIGDSIAVNGCCLTVTDVDTDRFGADVMLETLDRTTLGSLRAGDQVNLERAVTLSTRLGGHLVQGHVDDVGRIESRSRSAHWDTVWIEIPAGIGRYLVPKGSVAVDGISLTVVAVRDGWPPGFSVGLIPTTLQRTTLGHKCVGDQVNLEVDVLAKYTERLLDERVGRR
jgi:riboflavin synthase